MDYKKQVKKGHYEFNRYMSKERWISVWHQLDEIQKLKPKTVLEIGPGPGLLKMAAAIFGIKVETLDFDQDVNPDYVASATNIPFSNESYDIVCAFQMLEHLPYDDSIHALREMLRVSRQYVVISLPDVRAVWRYRIHIPKLGEINFLMPRPQLRAQKHIFDGEHYWEINKAGYHITRVNKDLSEISRIANSYRILDNPTHRIYVLEKK